MTVTPVVEFALTPKQLKALGPIIEEANREGSFGPKFCVVAQVKLRPEHGPYTKAIVRARMVDKNGFETVKRALVRAGVVEKKRSRPEES